MAYTKYTVIADGTEGNSFPISFILPYLSKAQVQVRVNEEVDGVPNPVYRSLTWTTDSLVLVGGDLIVDADSVVFTNTPNIEIPQHDFAAGAGITADKLDANQAQALLVAGMILDGRWSGGFEQLMDMGGHRITNVGDPIDDQDAATKIYVDAFAAAVTASELAAAASAAEALISEGLADADATQTALDALSTDADKTQTALDVLATAASAAAAAASAASNMYAAVTDKTADFAVLTTEDGNLFRADSTAAAVTGTLPLISTVTDGFRIAVVFWDGSNDLSIVPTGGDTIQGSATYVLINQYDAVTLVADFETNTWVALGAGAGAGNKTVDEYVAGVDYTKDTTDNLTLTVSPTSENNIEVKFDGVSLHHNTYSLVGAVLTFDAPIGADNVEVVSGTELSSGTPADASVIAAKIGPLAVTTVKIMDAAITLAKMAAEARAFDMPLNAAMGSDFTGEDLAVQYYADFMISRSGTFIGAVGNISTAGTGAAVIFDVLKNGTSIYSVLPQFTDGVTTLTAGTLKTDGTEDFVSGDVIVLSVTQVGSTAAGQRLRYTIKAELN